MPITAPKSVVLTAVLVVAVVVSCSLAVQGMASDAAMEMNGIGTGMTMPCCILQPFAGVDTALSGVTIPQGARDLLPLLFALTILFLAGNVAARFSVLLRGSPAALQWIRNAYLRKIPTSLERMLARGILQPQLYNPAVLR